MRTRDYYHTCYCLSGLSVAQNSPAEGTEVVVGHEENLLKRTHPVFNIQEDKVEDTSSYFRSQPILLKDNVT